MVVAFAIFLVIHGLLHLLGYAKGPGWPVATVLFIAAAISLFIWPKGWWMIGAVAIALSTILIASSWTEAKFGSIVNAIAFVGVLFGFLAQGPFSLRARFDRDVESRLTGPASIAPITESDLAPLPEPVRRYLQYAGVVGQPRVRSFHVRMHGRIRSNADARWMPLQAEQYNFVGEQPARFFYLNASMLGIPVQGYHRYADTAAEMNVKAAALATVAAAAGREMTQSETVTLFNDMCVMAPATLIDPAIVWDAVGANRVRARFTNAGLTIGAELVFGESGELVDFMSDDRYQSSPDGQTSKKVRWSTPVSGYRSFNGVRLVSGGSARWHEADGEYSYIELEIDEITYNGSAPSR